jgi:hypothetical protein
MLSNVSATISITVFRVTVYWGVGSSYMELAVGNESEVKPWSGVLPVKSDHVVNENR